MKNKKHIYMLLIFLVFMLSISAVSAAEDFTSDINSIDDNDEIILEETPTENNLNEEINLDDNLNEANEESNFNEEPILKGTDEGILNSADEDSPLSQTPGNFRDLDDLINNNTDPEITLDRDYVYSESDDLIDGVTINREVTINGNGFTLNGDTKARIFTVTNSNVVFKNINFIGGWFDDSGNGGAICGESTAINCTFTNNRATEGGAIYGGTAINCTFIDNYARNYQGGANGGAISRGTAINCTFTNNTAQTYGGALYMTSARNCNFTSNYGTYGGGAMFRSIAINSYFENNTIDGDQIILPETAICQVFALNCTFSGNQTWDYESTVVNYAYFEINNFTGRMADEENIIYMKLYGFLGDEQQEIYDLDCTLRVYKDGELYETKYLKTSRSWEIDLPAGNYTASVGIDDIPEVGIGNFTIKLTKNPSKITAENITAVYKNETYLKVMFSSESNWPIKHSGVSIDIDGNVTTDETDIGGCIYIPLKDLSIGEHNATVSMVGHSEYEDISATITITIIKIPTVIECEDTFITIYNTSENFTIRLADIYGNPVKGVELDIDLFPDVFFPTNDDGYAHIYPRDLKKLAGGNYTAKISFPGTTWDIYGPAETKNITIIIEKQNTTLSSNDVITTFNSDDKIVASIINQQGNPLSGVEISIDLIDGETFTTDANGQVEIPVNTLAAGEHEATITFNGNENYTESSYRIHITVNKDSTLLSATNVTTSIENESFITITLKDSQNRPIVNEKIIVWIDDIKENTTDENGEVKFSTKDLEMNTYNVLVLFYGNENYTASNTSARITITKGTPVVTLEDCGVNWGKTATVNITVKDKNGNPLSGIAKVYVAGYEEEGYEYYVPIDATGKGQATFVVELTPRAYRLKAVFLANDDYAEAEDDGLLIVYDSTKLNLEISANEAVFGEDTILRVKATDGRGQTVNLRKVNVTIGDETKEYDIEDGTVNIGKLAVGSTTIQVSPIHAYYDPVSVNLTATVKKANAIIGVHGDINLDYGDNATVTVSLMNGETPINGTVIVTVNNVDYAVDVTDGEGELKISGLIPNKYSIAAKFLGNDNYTEAEFDGEAYIEFNKYYADFDIIIPDGTYGENLTIIVENATDWEGNKLNGLVTGLIYDKDSNIAGYVEVNVTDGSGRNVTVPFSAGNLHATLTFYSDDLSYKSKTTRYDFTVAKAAPTLALTYVDGKLEITLDGVNEEKLNETIYIAIDRDEGQDYVTEDGAYSYDISSLVSGNHSAYVVFKGNDNYLARSAYTVFNIHKEGEPVVTNVTVAMDKDEYAYGDEAIISFTLKDIDGNNINGTLSVSIGEQNHTVDVTDGVGSLPVSGLNAGNYVVVTNYGGNENYTSSSAMAKFNVAKLTSQIVYENMTTTAVDVDTDGRVGEYFYITLTDSKGNALANKFVQIGFNGNVYNRTTDSDGKARLQINLKNAGTYTFAVAFLGDENYNGSFIVAKIVVNKQKGSLTVPNKSYKASATKTLTATFKSASGKPLASKKITFTVNGKTYSATTDSSGVAKVNVSLSAKGTYSFTAKFAGNNMYAAITKTAKLIIN